MKELELSGTPKQIGQKHGEAGKEEVMKSLDTYERFFKGKVGLSWSQAKEMANSHLKSIENFNSDYLEEMEGIAKGAGVDFEDILVLNTRSEIALTSNTMDGCTSLSVLKPIASNTFLGQNWDWRPSQIDSLLLTKIKQENKPDICMVTEGGIIGKIGFNSSGLGVCLNAIRADVRSEGVPIHLGLRRILDSYTLDEAVSKVINRQMGSTANFLLGYDDNNGIAKSVNMEVSPNGEGIVTTTDGALYHTNHLCSTDLKESIGEENLFTTDSSFVRLDRIKELTKLNANNKEIINQELIKNWFSDHFNYPQSICRHAETDLPEHLQTCTVFSVIMNLSERSMLLTEGSPCSPISEKVVEFSKKAIK